MLAGIRDQSHRELVSAVAFVTLLHLQPMVLTSVALDTYASASPTVDFSGFSAHSSAHLGHQLSLKGETEHLKSLYTHTAFALATAIPDRNKAVLRRRNTSAGCEIAAKSSRPLEMLWTTSKMSILLA